MAGESPSDPPAGQSAADATEVSADGPRPSHVEKALVGGPTQRTGRFEYHYDTDEWSWSDTVARIHGYEPDEVTPTTELVLSHKHPDDLAQVRTLLLHSSAPFSSRHRIITAKGEERKVVVVGDAVRDDDGRVVATRGFYIDITESFSTDLRDSVTEEMKVIIAHRQIIDMAKGMLMAIYRIDDESAFGILRWRSQELNVKLFAIAKKFVTHLPEILDVSPADTSPVDHFVMTLSADDTDDADETDDSG